MKKLAVVVLAAVVLGPGIVLAQGIFSDVTEDHEYRHQIEYAVQQGWFAGYEDGTFKPDRTISPAQMTTVFQRAFPDGVSRAEFAYQLWLPHRMNQLPFSTYSDIHDPEFPAPDTHSPDSVSYVLGQDIGSWTYWSGGNINAELEAYSTSDYPVVLHMRCDQYPSYLASEILIGTPWTVANRPEAEGITLQYRFSAFDTPKDVEAWSSENPDGSTLFLQEFLSFGYSVAEYEEFYGESGSDLFTVVESDRLYFTIPVGEHTEWVSFDTTGILDVMSVLPCFDTQS